MCHNCSNKCSDLSYIALPFWFQDLLGPYVFWVEGLLVLGLLGPRFLGYHVSIIRVLVRVFFFLGLGSWVSDFLVQDFGSKILWAFSFLSKGFFWY